jgi:hypothetical protein
MAAATFYFAAAEAASPGDALAEKIRIKLDIAAEAFNLEAKDRKALEKKIESYLLTAILKSNDAALTDKNFDAQLSVRFKTAAAFSQNENDSLAIFSAAGSRAASAGAMISGAQAEDSRCLPFHELFCFPVGDLKKTCESAASAFNDKILAGVREAKIRAAARRAAEEKKRREEYELTLKKQNELKKIEDIREWKLKKYSEWKSNRSMSILDEELEAAGMSFDELIKEFRDMSSSGK